MSSTFLKTNIHPFCIASCNFSKSFLVIATNSQFSVMFEVIWATYIVAVDCFFKKFSQKEVRWHKVCRWQWPNGMPDNVITGEVLQVSCCGFCTMGGCCIMLKPGFLFVLFQQSSYLIQKILKTFCCKSAL